MDRLLAQPGPYSSLFGGRAAYHNTITHWHRRTRGPVKGSHSIPRYEYVIQRRTCDTAVVRASAAMNNKLCFTGIHRKIVSEFPMRRGCRCGADVLQQYVQHLQQPDVRALKNYARALYAKRPPQ
eukprot:1185927-Prorocentrum_minimum.AAC.1